MKAINLFNKWVELKKDDGMELNHTPSVDFMLNLIPKDILKKKFRFLDLGCGNGWVVRKMSQYQNCVHAVGVDGAEKMIEKAKSKDSQSRYCHLDLNDIQEFNEKSDIIFSMEVIYYLEKPELVFHHIFNNLLNPGGVLLLGLDHYSENTPSLSWPSDLAVSMSTYSMLKWKTMLQKHDFSNINMYQFGEKRNWSGTLVFCAQKQ